MLPYLFPNLAAFATVADLITHLHTSDTRYCAALPAEFCAKNPPPMYITLYYLEPLVVTPVPLSLRGAPPFLFCPPELHSFDFSTAFLQGSLHEEIWLLRPPGFTGSFPPGTQWSLRRPVCGLRQAPREWHDTLRTTLAALGFAPSTADPSLFLRTDTLLPPFYILVYVNDLVFATADTAGLAHVKSELQKRHTCTDLGELRSYLGLQITRDRARRTITLTQSHMVQQVLQRFDFTYSSPQATPLSTCHSLSALPSDESVEPSGPSSCEAEIYARAMAAQELRWLTYLLTDLGEPPCSPPVLYVDNKAKLALCREHRLEHRTKHIALRYFLARELQKRGQLRLAYVASQANTADIFTKALQPCDHQRFCTMLCFPTFVDIVVDSVVDGAVRAGADGLCVDCPVLGLPPPPDGPHLDHVPSRRRPPLCVTPSPSLPSFRHPTSRRVLSSQDVTFDESVPYYRLFPYRTASLPPPPLFLALGPPLVDPLPPQGPAPSGVSQVDAVGPVEVAVDSGAATGAEPAGAGSGGAGSGGAETEGAEPGGAGTEGAEPGGAGTGGAEPGGAESGGAETWGDRPGGAATGGTEPGGVEPGGAGSTRVTSRGASSRREVFSPQELREWFARRWGRAPGAGGTTATTGSGGPCPDGAGAAAPGGTAEAAGVGPTGGSAGASGGTGAAGSTGPGAAGATGVGAAGSVGAGVSADAGTSEGTGAGAAGAGGATGAGVPAGSPGAVPAGSGGAPRPRPYFVPLLEQVLGLPPSPGPAPPFECPQPVQSQSLLQPVSPLSAPSPYTGPTGGLAERRAPASRPASPARPACTSRPRPPAVPGTHQMALRPSTAPLRVPLPSPPASSLPAFPDPESDSLRAASPTVARFLATVVTDPSLASTTASALVAELVDFAASCRLDYTASLVAESASVCPPSVGGECALSTDVLEDRQEEFQCFAAALPHLVSTMLTLEGDPDAPDIPTPRSYAEAIEGPYSSQWQAAMDAEMASWKSTGTYVDEVPPPGANIVSGMWIFRAKRPPGSPPVFKARYVARGFSQRQGVDYFQTFSPTPKMTTLRVLLHVATQRDYELHSLDFSTAFLQGSLHEEIWLRRPPGFTGSSPPGTLWSLRRPVYGLSQAPREWHDTLRTTLAALGFAPSTADPSLFLRTDTSQPPFYVLVYVDDLVFATADTAGLAHVKSELQKRHTCTDLGELRSYLGLQITQDRAQRTITLTQSHMVQQVLQRFDFT
ncbi:unnamed protein product, partial [Closterium sp. NIES-54]